MGPVRADDAPLVLVLRPAEEIPGLEADAVAEALDLSLGDLGIRARSGPGARVASEEEEVAAARAAGREARALAVVWYARPDAGRVRVHVLDLRAGRTTFQALWVEPNEDGAPRVLALKVRHLLRFALLEQAARSEEVRALVAPVVAKAAPRPRLRTALEWALAPGPSGVRHGPGGSIALGVGRSFEAGLALAFLDAGEREVETGRVRANEVALGLGGSVALARRRFDLLVGPAFRVHLLEASGTTNDGRSGSARATMPEAAVSVLARGYLGRYLALVGGVSAGILFGRERVLLLGEEAFDLGQLALELRLGMSTPGR